MAAASHWLAAGGDSISVPIGPECSYRISSRSLEFSTDHSYLVPNSDVADSDDEDASSEEDDVAQGDEDYDEDDADEDADDA
jgi:hypothetical protein